MAGLFVRDAVEAAARARAWRSRSCRRRRSATSASRTGTGSSATCAGRPWLALLCRRFSLGYARAARRAARDADLVHAHWLPFGFAALATGKPYVVQLWGTDVELARRAPWLFRPMLRRARLAIAASEFLADGCPRARRREVRVIPSGVEIPESVGEPEEPPHVLFVGRLSPEKGIHEFLAATEGHAAGHRRRRAGRRFPRRSASCRTPSSASTTSARLSSACRRDGRATASSRTRRWRTAGRSSRRRSAG